MFYPLVGNKPSASSLHCLLGPARLVAIAGSRRVIGRTANQAGCVSQATSRVSSIVPYISPTRHVPKVISSLVLANGATGLLYKVGLNTTRRCQAGCI